MFERFTQRARQTVVLAKEEARALKHDHIGTEHVLLALLRDPESVAGKALTRLGFSLPEVRRDVEKLIGRGDATPTGHIPFTPRAKKVLELSLREALNLKHNYIGTEHILLGLIREGEGVAAKILVDRGAELERVRKAVLAQLRGIAVEPAEPSRYTPAAAEILEAAAALAGSGPVGSHHLLEALARAEGSMAAKALAAVGADPDTLAERMDEIEIEDTIDMTPEQAAARRMEIRVADDEVQVVLRDEDARALARELTTTLGRSTVRGDDPLTGSLVGLYAAVVASLRELHDRLKPPAAEASEPEGRGVGAILRSAIRDRLRRRTP